MTFVVVTACDVGEVTRAVTGVVIDKVSDEVICVVTCVARVEVSDVLSGKDADVVNGAVVCVVIEAVTGLISCSLKIDVDSTALLC